MVMGRLPVSLASAVLCFSVAAPGVAQEVAGHRHSAGAPHETGLHIANRELLDALIKRRAEVAKSASNQGSHEALRFLDARIEEMTDRVMLDALLNRRASVAQSNNADATAFLDAQIAKVRSRLRD